MRISPEKLESSLSQGLQPLTVVLGEEPLLAFETLDALRSAAHRQGFVTREVLTVEPGFDWSALTLACNSNSLFGDKKLVELRIPSGKPGTEGARHLETLGRQPSEDTRVLVSLPALDYRTQQSAWCKALESSGLMVVAKNDRTHLALGEMFASRQVKKTYVALVQGKVERARGT
ncbi:MAG: hypothetical protein G3I10_06275, partial [Ferrovum sp.]|nr:hypothetical protein [Ferrovum sp.]